MLPLCILVMQPQGGTLRKCSWIAYFLMRAIPVPRKKKHQANNFVWEPKITMMEPNPITNNTISPPKTLFPSQSFHHSSVSL